MNIYILTQSENRGYDTYDSMVISAKNKEDAKFLSFIQCYALREYEFCMDESSQVWRNYTLDDSYSAFRSWSKNPDIELIGNSLVDEGIICASFNAG